MQEKNPRKGSVVVVDDDIEMQNLLRDFLGAEGFSIRTFSLATEALAALSDGGDLSEHSADNVDLVISDIKMPQMTGLEFVEKLKSVRPNIPVILITAFGSIESAIEAIRRGAFDYVVKPFKLVEMSITVERAIRFRKLEREHGVLTKEVQRNWIVADMIGKGPAMREVFDLVQRVAQATANVLITGESGTGKEMVARGIHRSGPRANRPFIAINCTSIPESLLESELFGHIKGSFTGAIQGKKGLFEEADGGTLFLDEIGDMDIGLQAKLLRVIQERKIKRVGENIYRDIDVRIIAATHKDLKAAIKDGRFREDLYYRLSVIPIVIPPLRHRKEDIPLLAEHFLRKYAAANHSGVIGFTKAAVSKMLQLKWEGNVRELENVVERAVVLAKSNSIDEAEIPIPEDDDSENFFGSSTQDSPTLEQLEMRYIQLILEKTGGRKEKAAQILGINRRTLYRKEREYGFVHGDEPMPEDDRDSNVKGNSQDKNQFEQ